MKIDDILINKSQSIERCIKRAKEEYLLANGFFDEDYSRQDASILNIVRACEQALDLANYIVKKEKLGVPSYSRDSFDFLANSGIISQDLSDHLIKMVQFRNLVIHQYQEINLEIVKWVLHKGFEDLAIFIDKIKLFSMT